MDNFKFSLILCTYARDNPEHLTQCLESISSQTVMPDELVIVKDGSLTNELETVLQSFRFQNIINTISLKRNMTLGIARAAGVEAAAHEWLALMDSDDVCLPDRFEKQIAMLKVNQGLDIIGGQIEEYYDIPGQLLAIKRVPVMHKEILAYAKIRNPFNAMTVMFKKELAKKAGNFRYFPGFEDYDLWVRMLKNGAICQNSPEVLVQARVGNGMYARRSGLKYVKQEWRMQRQLQKLHIINTSQFIVNLLKRTPVRLLPKRLHEKIYLSFLRSKI